MSIEYEKIIIDSTNANEYGIVSWDTYDEFVKHYKTCIQINGDKEYYTVIWVHSIKSFYIIVNKDESCFLHYSQKKFLLKGSGQEQLTVRNMMEILGTPPERARLIIYDKDGITDLDTILDMQLLDKRLEPILKPVITVRPVQTQEERGFVALMDCKACKNKEEYTNPGEVAIPGTVKTYICSFCGNANKLTLS